MRSSYKYSLFLVSALVLGGILISCSDDDAANGGQPSISYIRITDPASSDSLVVSAGQGQMIAIIGENLEGAREMWINDREAPAMPRSII